MSSCKFHSDQEQKNCKWCRRWHKTYKYFKDRGCRKLYYYWITLEHYRTGEAFQKIGLTSKSIEKRFERDLERFRIIPQLVTEYPLYTAVTVENHILHQLHLTDRLYNPKARISGWSECFI